MATINSCGNALNGATGTGKYAGNTSPSIVTGFLDANGVTWITQTPVASAVNGINIQNNTSTNSPVISAQGADSNIFLQLKGKGTSGAQVQGVSTSGTAPAGFVGEIINSVIIAASSVPVTSNVARNVTSISLTAGDWDVWGNVSLIPTGATFSNTLVWISQTSATQPDSSVFNSIGASSGILAQVGIAAPSLTFQLSTTTTIFLSTLATFAAGTANACGGIYARRVR